MPKKKTAAKKTAKLVDLPAGSKGKKSKGGLDGDVAQQTVLSPRDVASGR